MIQIRICEDDKPCRETLKHMLLEYAFQKHIDFGINEHEAPSELLATDLIFDILFLDISFNGEHIGVETAHKLREKGCVAVIVYITSYPDYSIEGYETDAFRYLVKPVTSKQIRKTMDSIFEKWSKGAEYIKIRATDGLRLVDVSKIMYIDTIGKKLMVHCNDEAFDTWDTLQSLFAQLPQGKFAYVSKSCFVRLPSVVRLLPKDVVMPDGIYVSLSRRYKDSFKDSLDNFIKSKHRK